MLSACYLSSIVDIIHKHNCALPVRVQLLINIASVISALALHLHLHHGGIYPCVSCLNSLTKEEWDENKWSYENLLKIISKPKSSLGFMEDFSR